MTDLPQEPILDEQDPVTIHDDPAAIIAKLQEELGAMKDQALRALAEADNTRKRAEKEKQDISKYAITAFARDLLTVMDTFDRALASVPATEAGSPFQAFAEGVAMTADEMQKTFEKHGVKAVGAVGEKFDHNLHQAMMEVESTTIDADHIAQVLQGGYVLYDRLLRPALVGVAKK
jgi:molecular chaperone GrpE